MAVVIIGLAHSILLARYLGPEGRGLYSLIGTVLAFATYWTTLGLGQSALRAMSRGEFAKNLVLGDSLYSWLAQSSLALATLAAWIIVFPSSFSPIDGGLLFLLFIAAPIQHLFGMASYSMLGIQQYKLYNIAVFLRAFCGLSVAIVVIYFNFGVLGAVFADIMGFLLASLFLINLIQSTVGRPTLKFSRDRFFRNLGFGVPVYISSSLMLLHNRADVLLLTQWASFRDIGLYSVAAGLSERVLILPSAVSTVLFPYCSARSDSSQDRSQNTTILLRWIGIAMVLTCSLIAWFSAPLITLLFSNDFFQSSLVCPPLLIGAFSLGLYGILESDLKARGDTTWLIGLNLFSVLTNLILNFTWIPSHGILGAAVATSISYTLLLALTMLRFLRLAKISLAAVLLPSQTDKEILLSLLRRFVHKKEKTF